MKASRSELVAGRAVLAFMVVFTLAPFAALVSAALQEAGSNPTGLAWPDLRNIGNFTAAFRVAHLPELTFSSVLLVLMVVPAAVIMAALAGYAIAVRRVPLGGIAFLVLLAGLAIPFESLITPLYYQMRDYGLLNTRWAIALPLIALFMPFGVVWMRAHFQGVPRELTEAAEVDGATSWRLLWSVHLPLARPALTSLAVLFSLWTWNQFILALVMVEDPLRRTMAGALGAFRGQYGPDLVLMSAGSLLIMLPTILVFIVFQKHFSAALLQGSVKG